MTLPCAQLRKIAILVVLIAVVGGCSSTRLIYAFASGFIQDEVAYFLDLDEEEGAFLGQQVAEMVAWHKKTVLPNYAAFLNDMANKLDEGQYGAADIAEVLAAGQSLIEETVTGLTPHASKVLVRHMTGDDIAFMEEKMAVRRQERLDEISKPEDIRYADRIDRLKTNFERFFGDLTDGQVTLLEAHALATLGDPRVRLRNRTLLQRAFVAFLKTQPVEAALTAHLNKLLLRGYEITNPDYKAFSKASFERFSKLLVSMLAISLPAQRETIIVTLRDYAEDFKSVSS